MAGSARLFLRQFWTSPRSVGAALPSSRGLAEAMVAPIDFARAEAIIEFGPGTGPFTKVIAERLRPGQRYVGIELNEAFCQTLAAQFPTLAFEHDTVERLGPILEKHGIEAVDAIICGLPWASLPVSIQSKVFAEIERWLKPDGLFITFAYLQGLLLPGAWALRRRLGATFGSVTHTPIVWRNVPPAFAYLCRK